MKKIVIVLLTIFFYILVQAQTSSGTWNSSTATYTNAKHNITWNLLNDLTWVERPILKKNILFNVLNQENQIAIKLVATYNSEIKGDAWNLVSQLNSKAYLNMMKAETKKNGMTLNEISAIKSQLCGIHAAKVKTDMSNYHPEHDATTHYVEYAYHLYKDNYIYSIYVYSLSILGEELSNFDRIATSLFNGFNIK